MHWRKFAYLMSLGVALSVSGCGGGAKRGKNLSDAAEQTTTGGSYAAQPTVPEKGKPIEMDIAHVAYFAEMLPADERREQLADWALSGVLSFYNLDAEGFQLAIGAPLLRSPNLTVVGEYQYGLGRYAVLPDGDWIILVPDGPEDPAPIIGRLADALRAKQGEIPKSVMIYSYRPRLYDGGIDLVFLETISGETLFSKTYHYVEQVLTGAADLAAWLKQTDDLGHIALNDDGTVTVGGRAIGKRGDSKITVEDVAALYQTYHKTLLPTLHLNRLVGAHNKLQDEGRIFDNATATIFANHQGGARFDCEGFDAAQQRLIAAVPSLGMTFESTCAASDIDAGEKGFNVRQDIVRRINERLIAYRAKLDAAPAPQPILMRTLGFSLDPFWHTPSLLRDLELLRDNPQMLHDEAGRIAAGLDVAGTRGKGNTYINALAAIIQNEPPPAKPTGEVARALNDLIKKVASYDNSTLENLPEFTILRRALYEYAGPGGNIHNLLLFVRARNQTQCALYSGDLLGTEVGMSLFYTDIVAKLWVALDYRNSAPFSEVLGFSSAFHNTKETTPLDRTRLWLGPKISAINQTESSLTLAPQFTRIFSAASDTANPGQEVPSGEADREAFDWWSNHFGEVASFDPQYDRLNQIQKWSLATLWLAKNDRLGDLSQVAVTRSLRFDKWAEAKQNLSYRPMVALLPDDRWIQKNGYNECLNLLAREQDGAIISGGVSLAGLGVLEKTSPHGKKGTAKSVNEVQRTYKATKRGQFTTIARVAEEKLAKDSPQVRALVTDISRSDGGDGPSPKGRGKASSTVEKAPAIYATMSDDLRVLELKMVDKSAQALDSQKTFLEKHKGANFEQIYDDAPRIDIAYEILGEGDLVGSSAIGQYINPIGREKREHTMPAGWQGRRLTRDELFAALRDASIGNDTVAFVSEKFNDGWHNAAATFRPEDVTATEVVVVEKWPLTTAVINTEKGRYVRFHSGRVSRDVSKFRIIFIEDDIRENDIPPTVASAAYLHE